MGSAKSRIMTVAATPDLADSNNEREQNFDIEQTFEQIINEEITVENEEITVENEEITVENEESVASAATAPKKMNMDSFKLYLHKLMKEKNPRLQISRECVETLDGEMHRILDVMATGGTQLLNLSNRKTLTEKELQAILISKLGPELAEKVINKANIAMINFKNSFLDSNGKT